ncbi:hypothetical protein VB620_10560 [Nodularia harveyana UHCC-0300]|uniref:Uncharacterized protein n=1 Tax=Nodularia harveyana UHCC-0300 TaxID=2974287 RepID=A0ABU5UE57_9CYAN|nr:hypothetical protein [Nodularia harveyana]MEA5581777.1 hypothetical protein [Nodularia harveyana UHCC-0300]
MTIEENGSKRVLTIKAIYKFIGGAALGIFVVSIPILYGSSTDVNLFQVSMASLLIIVCGLLSSIWGEKFINSVMNVLNSSGL